MKLLPIAGIKVHHTNSFFFLSLTATDDLCGLCDKQVFEMNVRLNCLCWRSQEKSKNLTQFCSQSPVSSKIWLNCRTSLAIVAMEQRVSTSGDRTSVKKHWRSLRRLLLVTIVLPDFTVMTWWLEMFCCQRYKTFWPGDDPSRMCSCCPLLPCTKQAASHEAFLH